ncbi:MAG: tRNA (N6-isopentenyl adenosine(37)-C2)-methylthiotransferase MiaB [Firmicutes bacterium]|jgi:tRNA-2-methylthio-N6-dimethylallyladenosine synthase|nr:tRNA (N6-isopentenyl adenosine(37)-C2)-methylthiotransferase MiaB [Bacillota bacterium]
MNKHDWSPKKYFILTYGCQMNVFDSEVLSGILEAMGYSPANSEEDTDVLLINTCAVRQKAEEKVLSKLGRLRSIKKKNPEMLLVIWGCMVQQKDLAEQISSRYKYIDLIGGPHALERFPQLLEKARTSSKTVIDINDEGERDHLHIKRGHDFKAWVPISHGCSNYCTYCIVPYVRGPERSRPPERIIQEVKELAKNGYKEITLLGQNVNSYGKDIKGGLDFADLLQRLDAIEGLARIRYMTSHPRDFNDKIIRTIEKGRKICEHFHLPVQSGSNKILKLMNRGYTREYYLELINKIKSRVEHCSITSDIIIGFPGEEDADYQDTLDLIQKVQFDAAYVFIYSPRKGTKATAMADQVDLEIKKERIKKLNKIQGKISLDKNRQLLGTKQEILVEERSKTNPDMITGRTRTNKIVHFSSEENLLGKLIDVEIIEAKSWTLTGKYLP